MEANEYNLCVQDWADALFRFACKCTGQAADAHDVVAEGDAEEVVEYAGANEDVIGCVISAITESAKD